MGCPDLKWRFFAIRGGVARCKWRRHNKKIMASQPNKEGIIASKAGGSLLNTGSTVQLAPPRTRLLQKEA